MAIFETFKYLEKHRKEKEGASKGLLQRSECVLHLHASRFELANLSGACKHRRSCHRLRQPPMIHR